MVLCPQQETPWPQPPEPPTFIQVALTEHTQCVPAASPASRCTTQRTLCCHGVHILELCLFIVEYVPDIVGRALPILPNLAVLTTPSCFPVLQKKEEKKTKN